MHWRGSSSTGKTAAGEVAGSVCGGGGRDGYTVTWRATDNGIESVAAVHNDGLLVLDEIGQVSADALGGVAYMLANGQGKRRMTRDGSAQPTAAWSLSFLSTGEIGLADKLRESNGGGGRAMAGQQVRVLDLPSDAGAGLGVFDTLHQFANGQALADHLKAAAMANYGHPLRAYVRCLVADPPFDGIKQFAVCRRARQSRSADTPASRNRTRLPDPPRLPGDLPAADFGMGSMFLDRLVAGRAIRSRLEPIKGAARTVMRHRDGILSWFDSHIANGLIEGIDQPRPSRKGQSARLPINPNAESHHLPHRRQTRSETTHVKWRGTRIEPWLYRSGSRQFLHN